MVRRTMFPVEGFGDEHLPEDGVDVEHLVGRLICSHPGDAVSDRDVLVLVRADLQDKRDSLAGTARRLPSRLLSRRIFLLFGRVRNLRRRS